MTQFNKGDKVRYKLVTGYESYAGLEGVVEEHKEGHNPLIRITKGVKGNLPVGRTVSLMVDNLELIPAPLAVGDKIRTNQNVSGLDWLGVEGVITEVKDSDGYAKFKITANPPKWHGIGSVVNLPRHKFDVVTAEVAESTELPREVKVSEIRAGDTVRVTYPENKSEAHGVTERVAITRTGTVSKVDDGELITEKGYLINSRLWGLDEAVYTLLERPEVKRTTATEPVGAQFKAESYNGRRLLTKVAENKWSDIFLKTGNVYTSTDFEAQEAFDERKGEWVEV